MCLTINAHDISNSIEWLLQDAYKDEHISLSEAKYVLPCEVSEALIQYNNGQYRKCIEVLEKVRKLHLPDKRMDFICFLLGESYRQLKLIERARQEYEYITTNFPESDKIPPSLYRIIEFASEKDNPDLADSVYQAFYKKYYKHPLFNSVVYTYGRLLYKMNRFDEAILLLGQVEKNSTRYFQAQFVIALCNIQIKEPQKALVILDNLKKSSQNTEIIAEATILIGDIHYTQNNYMAALDCYKSIPESASRYNYAIVKAAKNKLDLGYFLNAKEIAIRFLRKYKASDNYFEMASILEQAYSKLGDQRNSLKVDNLIQEQIVKGKLTFEIFQEIDNLVDLAKNWQLLEYDAIRSQDQQLLICSQNAKKKIKELELKYNLLLSNLHPNNGSKKTKTVPHLAERRYLALLKKQMNVTEDSIDKYKGEISNTTSAGKATQDINISEEIGIKNDKLTLLQTEYQKIDKEYSLILKECLGGEHERKRTDEELQTKFVDWAFLKYQDKKETLKKMAEEISFVKNNNSKKDSIQKDKILAVAFTQLNYKKIENTLIDERNRLIDHIEMMKEIYKKNSYNPQVLFRLAELYYERSGDAFKELLRQYENKIRTSNDTSGLVFPEYNLSKVIEIYDQIINQYPRCELSDDAYYYKSMALQKEGNEDSANAVLLQLVDKYPESEFFVEANMNIGRYYFEHPKIMNNSGYRIAEEAFRRVLFYRDHPQFVQALYHLGWCYYMQDKYDEAIVVFKYLVEEAKLDFDATKMEEKQVVNPLLRGEAIDYIAISFDEEGKVDDVLKFLQLIGNDDYSSLILKRIAELREEDMDFGSAIRMYNRLLKQFPSSISAPDAVVGLIKIYDSHEKADSAMIERKKYFDLFSRGSEWNNQIAQRDSTILKRVDSISIAMALYVADANYRTAETNKNADDYLKAANSYRKVIEKYSDMQNAAYARWNLAVILDTKLFDKHQAYNEFMKLSGQSGIDSTKREQAALNAIAIAQSLLPADSVTLKKSLDLPAEKVVESVKNYLSLFPTGSSCNKVLLGLGAIYFNHQMFDEAQLVYQKVVSKGSAEKEYYEALLFVAQCKFGLENWPKAIELFEKVYKESGNNIQKDVAYKFLLQSEFIFAKGFIANTKYELAANAFLSIEQKYPGSEYGDIVLFNAAEAFEKIKKMNAACDSYYDLVSKYPASKFAPDALFNAANDYEKIEKFSKAAESYEMLVKQYPKSDKAKDALFNLGLCYEKLGKMDEMAQINERYSSLYPEEKDVETMLLRSAAYYAKTAIYDKAINVYRNFIKRFPTSGKTIEAFYMIAKCNYELGDKDNALLGFNKTEMQNMRFAQEGGVTNNYYASEAAYFIAMLKREKFLQIKLVLPDNLMKKAVKEKSDLLNESAKAFQRVMQYQSERMFEAAYMVGQLYEEMSDAYKNQERPKLDPINMAVLEKDILSISSQLLQKSFIPYIKVIDLSKQFDSLGTDQKLWIQKSRLKLTSNWLNAGQLLFKGIAIMNNAPIPKEIEDKSLLYFQYKKQLLETLAPLKIKVVDYYSNILDQIDTLKLADDSCAKECVNQFVYVNFLIADGFDRLASSILKLTQDISKKLSVSEKENLLFQLEDIVYELQDKAIVDYEDALKKIEKRQLSDNSWYIKIIECLARLSPDKYGTSFYKTDLLVSGSNWVCRSDSVSNWNSNTPPKKGWKMTKEIGWQKIALSSVSANKMWTSDTNNHVYFWKNIFLNGTPRNASVYVSTSGKYNLFINGALTLKDTIGNKDPYKIDSATGIAALVKGGDNVITVETSIDSGKTPGLGIIINILIDSTQHFKSDINLPEAFNIVENAHVQKSEGKMNSIKTPASSNTNVTISKKYNYRNREEFLNVITEFRAKESEMNNQIRAEQNYIAQLRNTKADLDLSIQKIHKEIAELKLKLRSNLNVK